jgi:hypothetical protein
MSRVRFVDSNIKVNSGNIPITASHALSGNGEFTGSFTGSFFGNGNGLFGGQFVGDGTNLTIPDASQIVKGSVSASISETKGLEVNTLLNVAGTISASRVSLSSTSATNPAYTFWDNDTTGMLSTGPGNLQLQVNGGTSPEFEIGINQSVLRTDLNISNHRVYGVTNITASQGIKALNFIGDGSQLTGIDSGSWDGQFTGDAQITGSLIVSGSLNAFVYDSSNVNLGHNAGLNLEDGATANVLIGKGAGENINFGDGNVIIGRAAGSNANNGFNTFLGAYAGQLMNATGGENVAVGYKSGNKGDSNAQYNSFLGAYSGEVITSGKRNLVLGYMSGYNLTSGNNNIILGHSASLASPISSNQLFIGSGSTPLISGSLDTGNVIIPSSLEIGSTTSDIDTPLKVHGSGSNVFEVIGSEGTLFTVDDDLEGMLFTANNRSGFPVLQASSSGEVWIGKTPQSLYTTATISDTTPNVDNVMISMSTGSYDGAFFEYTAISGSNARSGNISSIWNEGSVEFAESSTLDIGDTTDLIFEVKLIGGKFQLISNDTSGGYKLKTIIKVI